MIYDCFQFFNELDLLALRLNVLDPVVDRFVISESTVTFSGRPKPLYYAENKALFKKFENKIIHNVVADTPDTDPFSRDSYQKNAVAGGLKDCVSGDVIIFSDLDEIPDPEKIKASLARFDSGKIYHFAQRLFYFYLNLEEVSGSLLSFTGEFDGVRRKKWLGSKMFDYSMLKSRTIESTRFPEAKAVGARVDDGGWHFSYVGGDSKDAGIAERVRSKIISAAHQEYNNEKILSAVDRRIAEKKDVFGRRSKFKAVPIDGSFPKYLADNLSEYRHLIIPDKK